jgi:hypothetical protein
VLACTALCVLGFPGAAQAGQTTSCTAGWLGPYGRLNAFQDANCNVSVQGVTLPSAETTGAGATSFAIPDGSVMEAGVGIASGFTLSLPAGHTLTDAYYNVVGANGGDLYVGGGATFTIGAGATFKLGSGGAGPDVIFVAGTLTISGDSGSPTILTSAAVSPAAGDWGRIEFLPGSTGTVGHAQISYAGGYRRWGANGAGIYFQAGILVDGAAPIISNSSVDHSAGNGIEAVNPDGSAPIADPLVGPTITADTLTDNTGWAIYYDYWPDQLTGTSGPQVSGLSASGNGHDLLGVMGGTAQASGEWHDPGIPIRTDRGQPISIPAGITWTIDAGTTIQFTDPDPYWSTAHQTVYVLGTLDVNGTAADPVVLTSGAAVPAIGDWGRIEFVPGGTGTLTHVRLSYAGAYLEKWGSSHASYATEILADTTSPTITNAVLDNSAGNDVEAVNGALPVLTTNSFLAVPPTFHGVINDAWTTGQVMIDATCSWWGSTTGPTSVDNPGGTGTPASSGVKFSPFSTSSMGGCATSPDVPTNVLATQGDGSIGLNWTAPNDNGSTIAEYDVACEPTCGSATGLMVTGTPALTSTTIAGLTIGTLYRFSVTATNAAGTSSASALSNAVTFATHPGAPMDLVATPGDAAASLSWTAPVDGGSPITSYTVAYKAAADISWTTVQPSPLTGLSMTIGSLVNGTTYSFKVRATNAVGDGPYSPETTATPLAAATVPAAPAAPTAVATSTPTGHDSQYRLNVDLSWTAPDNGGSSISNYRITLYIYKPSMKNKPATYRMVQAITTGSVSTSYTVQGLSSRNAYVFTVTAGNAVGWGPESGYSNLASG